jgi:hypothetical protein
MRIVLSWAVWRRPTAERAALLSAAQASQSNAVLQKEVKTMVQTYGDELLAQGEARGEARGEKKGALSALRKMLRRLLEDHFGTLPETVKQRIESATDPDRLEAAVVQAPRLDSLEQLQL